ncbi:MAG: hemolysin family protein [Acidimicrobiales bacterium]
MFSTRKKQTALSISSTEPSQAAQQEQYILSTLNDLRDMEIREVMTPRMNVIALAIPVSSSAVARAVKETGHSRFPVYDGDLDNMIGVLFVNDLFRAGWEIDDSMEEVGSTHRLSSIDISRRIRQPHIVPESRHILDVLADMRRNRRAFAMAVDEYGGVAGIVTLKDLLAALVGDLKDELDPADEPDVVRVDHRRWLVNGGLNIDDTRDRLGIELPEGEYVTLAGFLLDVLGHIPEEGEQVDYGSWSFKVQEMDKRRIARIVILQPPAGSLDSRPNLPRTHNSSSE